MNELQFLFIYNLALSRLSSGVPEGFQGKGGGDRAKGASERYTGDCTKEVFCHVLLFFLFLLLLAQLK